MADNLESYFKKHLSEENPVEENWNVPSDEVWNKVLPEIQKKRGLFIPWKYFYLLGILLIVGLTAIFWFVNTTDTINENDLTITQIEEIQPSKGEEAPMTIENESSTIETKNKNIKKEIQNTSSANEQIANEDESKSLATTSANTAFGENLKISQANMASSQNTNTKEVINFSPPIEQFETEVDRTDPQITMLSQKTIDKVSSSTSLTLLENDAPTEPLIDRNQINRKEPFNNKGKFGIGAFIAPTFNATRLNGEMSQGKIETSDMYLYSTNWGFEIKYFISNRFALVTGVGKSEIKSWSKSLIDFDYDSSTEHDMPSGEKENTSPIPMQTPFGKINTEITYRFPGDEEIPDGEPMYSVTETHQDLRYLSIPLGVEFNIIRFSQFNWIAEAGIQYNRALRDATDFNSRVLHNGHDMDIVDEQMTSHPSYTQNYLSYYLGTGINYQFSKSFQINGSVRYFGSITELNLQDNMSTYAHGFNLKFGIVYIF